MMPIVPKIDQKVDVRRLLEEGAVLLDIRTEEEFVGFHLRGAFHIPLDDLTLNLESIRRWQKPVVVYGANDRRSSLAASRLNKRGVFAVDGGSIQELQNLLK